MGKIKNFNEVNEEEEKVENPIPTESKKAKVWKVIKAVAYGAAFIAGAGVVLVLSHLGNKDEEEEKKDDDLTLDDITDNFVEAAKENPEIKVTEF